MGLTLVVYFIYREVEYLREKVDKLERTINSNPKSIEQLDNNILDSDVNLKPVLEEKKFPVLALPKMEESLTSSNNLLTINGSLVKNNEIPNSASKSLIHNKNSSPKVSPKLISVDLMSTTSNSLKFNVSPGIQMDSKNQVQKKINDILEQSDSDSDDSTTSVSESSKHLAIYSNDNEQFDETQNSLMESVEANKNDLKFDYNRMEIPDLKGTMESIMNNLSSDANSENKKSPIDEIIEEKEKQLSQMTSEKSLTKISKQESSNHYSESDEIKITISKKSETDEVNEDSKSNEINEQTLNNMKLPEVKKIAEQNKITITKKAKGQQKPKNKNELITEILNKINK